MKLRYFKAAGAAMCAAMMLTSCNSLGGLSGSNGSQGILESVLGTLVGNSMPVNEQTVVGTWQYASPEVRFESENALANAGGLVAAQQAEAKLAETYASVGIKPGACSFTFENNKKCTLVISGQKVSGNFSINPDTHEFVFTPTLGLVKLNGKIYYTGQTLTVVFDAQKLLQVLQVVGSVTGQGNATLSTLSALASQYSGMMLGMNLKK